MGDPVSSQCRSCHAPIVWAITNTGRRMPVDAEPAENGTLVLYESTPGEVHVAPASEHPTIVDRHVSHFATCPNAAQHRRAR